jgi:hypothetical protein
VIRATSAVDAAAAPLYVWTGPPQDAELFTAVRAAAAAATAAAAMPVTVAVRDTKIQSASVAMMSYSYVSSSGGGSNCSSSSTHISVSNSHRHSTVHYAHNSSCGPAHATLFHNAVFINGILTPV